MAFASGKRAYGICDISGFRYRLRDMKMTWDGFLVGTTVRGIVPFFDIF